MYFSCTNIIDVDSNEVPQSHFETLAFHYLELLSPKASILDRLASKKGINM